MIIFFPQFFIIQNYTINCNRLVQTFIFIHSLTLLHTHENTQICFRKCLDVILRKEGITKLRWYFELFYFCYDETGMFNSSCGTVALYGPFLFFFFFLVDHRATDFTLSKTFENARWKFCAPFLHVIVMKSGPRTIKHICIVLLDIYLHSSILTYLLIIISSSLL